MYTLILRHHDTTINNVAATEAQIPVLLEGPIFIKKKLVDVFSRKSSMNSEIIILFSVSFHLLTDTQIIHSDIARLFIYFLAFYYIS